ncbi:hypothetical protein ACFFHH_13930 [Cytobacillus solani]|nr:hypothetical protein [Cytobacillus solani]
MWKIIDWIDRNMRGNDRNNEILAGIQREVTGLSISLTGLHRNER